MSRGKALSEEEKGMIKAFKEMRLSNRKIAIKIKRSPRVINNYVNNPKKYGKKRRIGRKPKLNSRDKRRIIRAASNRCVSSAKIIEELSLKCSRWTVNRAINNSGVLKLAKKMSTPPLTDEHKVKRLEFARLHMTWNSEWRQVAWSDEKRFNLDGPDGYHYYWHDLRKEDIYSVRRTMGGGGVMVWAAFGYHGKSTICFVEGKLNAKGYRNLLGTHLQDLQNAFGGKDMIFQQDNAPAHRAKANKPWFSARNIRLLQWPALSPDLNPIENAWGMLARRVYAEGKQYFSIQDLKTAIINEWNNIPLDDLRKLSESMPNRIFEVIQNHGTKTKY
jgi:transposase